jgi:acyl-CoA oxidase
MSFASIELKMMYVNRTPESNKAIHIVSSAYKATFTWNNMRTLQVLRITIILGCDRL